ncbi:uncharacterized protein LOC120342295 [Styela clava]
MSNDTALEVRYTPKNQSSGVRGIVESSNVTRELMDENCMENRNANPERAPRSVRVANDTCGYCSNCNKQCCENGACKRSKRDDKMRRNRNDETKPCCSEKKKKSIFFRKSTSLLLSGFCMLGVTIISIADIATDVLTAREYYLTDRMVAFGLSLVFLIIPPILLTAGIIRRRDDSIRNTTTSTTSCCIKFVIFVANVPLKLYMIWLQIVFSFTCFKRFAKWRKSGCPSQEEKLMGGSLSHFITELTLYKLWNSVFESMPQLLLTIHVIMTSPQVIFTEQGSLSNEGYLLIASSSFSFGSLCVGIIFYVIKAKEAECQPVSSKRQNQPLRSKSTRLNIPQIVLISVYTVCFLGTRALSLSYFIVFYEWFAIIVPALHWIALFVFFTYRRYINQNSTMHHYRVSTYHRQSSSFVYVFVHSIISVFIHIKPECEEVLDQPKFYKIIYYLFYTIENCIMMLMPLILMSLPEFTVQGNSSWISNVELAKYEYYTVTYVVLGSLAIGCFSCAIYHFMVHKSSSFTREQVFGPCCKCCFGPGGFLCFSCSCCCCCRNRDESKIFIACKNLHTHEIVKTSLKDMKLWKETTESKLLNKKPLRSWKKLHNELNASARKEIEANSENSKSETSVDIEPDPTCPYTMRRSGLHILSDPQGNLFYAPIADIKLRTEIIT